MDKKHSILLIEKDKIFADTMDRIIREIGFKIKRAIGVYEALQMLKFYKIDLVVLDISVVEQDLPLMSSSETLKIIRKFNGNLPVIILLDKDKKGKEDLIYLIKEAFDYLIKPVDFKDFKEKINNILRSIKIQNEVKKIKKKLKKDFGFDEIIGKCDKMVEVFNAIKNVADSNVTVFISGESGTGKELIAREIHKNSLRKGEAFIPINCAAIPETLLESELFGYEKGAFTGADNQRIGKFESADKGTLFLDEIGEMSLSLQVKILRIIEKQEFERIGGNKTVKVDVRIITATNKILKDEVKSGNFRKDLYYRIMVYPIYLPPLRERKEDISILVEHSIKIMAKKNNKSAYTITPQALELLEEYSWPGNIRELENVIERAVLVCKGKRLTVEDFSIFKGKMLDSQIDTIAEKEFADKEFDSIGEILPIKEIEKKYLKYALRLTNGNISKAAKKLKIGRATLYRKLQKYKIINNG